LQGGSRRFDLFSRLFGGFLVRFGEFSRSFEYGLGESHLLLRGLGSGGCLRRFRMESLRRSSQLRAILWGSGCGHGAISLKKLMGR
jgi:hypothetical protein